MNMLQSQSPARPPVSLPACGAINLFALLAIAISVFILYNVRAGHAHRIPGCADDGNTCEDVVKNQWGYIGMVPVAVVGIAGYATLLGVSLASQWGRVRRFHVSCWRLLALMSVVGLGFIVWLLVLQGFIIGHFCKFCLAAHACGSISFFIVLRKAPVWSPPGRAWLGIGTPAFGTVAILVALHILLPTDLTVVEAYGEHEAIAGDTEGAYRSGGIELGKKHKARRVELLNGDLVINPYEVPLVGNPEAEHVVVELFDYQCPACRKVYALMKKFEEKHPDRVAVVTYVVPMEASCNPNVKRTLTLFQDSCEYTRLALAVRSADAAKFPGFHDWLMEGEYAPRLDAARERAKALVGEDVLQKALDDPKIDEWISDAISIYGFIEATRIPKILARDRIISSSGLAKKKLFRSLEEALELP